MKEDTGVWMGDPDESSELLSSGDDGTDKASAKDISSSCSGVCFSPPAVDESRWLEFWCSLILPY